MPLANAILVTCTNLFCVLQLAHGLKQEVCFQSERREFYPSLPETVELQTKQNWQYDVGNKVAKVQSSHSQKKGGTYFVIMSPYSSMKPCHLIPLSDLEMNSMDCECYYANSKLSFSNQFACTRENELILSWLAESVTFLLPLVSEQESWKIFTFLIAGWSPHSFFGPKQIFPPFYIVINSWTFSYTCFIYTWILKNEPFFAKPLYRPLQGVPFPG